jgi:hypothetical protein
VGLLSLPFSRLDTGCCRRYSVGVLDKYSNSFLPHVIPTRITAQAAVRMAALMTREWEELMLRLWKHVCIYVEAWEALSVLWKLLCEDLLSGVLPYAPVSMLVTLQVSQLALMSATPQLLSAHSTNVRNN